MELENTIKEYIKNSDYRGLVSKFTRVSNKKLLNSLKENLLVNDYEIDKMKETSQLLYHFINKIKNIPICSHCKENTVKYKNITLGYFEYCSNSCQASSIETQTKTKKAYKEKYGVDHHTKTESYKEKFKIFKKEKNMGFESDRYKKIITNKYGVENISQLQSVKEKKKKTFRINYGVDCILSDRKYMNDIMVSRYGYSNFIPKENKRDFDKYKDIVIKYTKRYKKKILETWDGYDYYDGEFIKDYYNLDYNDNRYPTLDHKISIQYGYSNKIDPQIIGNIENICITKRIINRVKSCKIEEEFIKYFNKNDGVE
jgi:hypothetical protein